MSEPVSHLADLNRLATSMAYAKDLSVFKEHSRTNAPQQFQPKAPPAVKTPPPMRQPPPKGGRQPRRPVTLETAPAPTAEH